MLKGTPTDHGFSFPAEWVPHRGTWISWPRPEGISFPGKYHEAIEDIAGLIRVLVAREEVHLNVPNDNYERIVRDFLKARRIPMRRVFFHHIPTNEAWARDHGPAFVLRTRRGKTEAAIVDWGFNAWGGKYPPWDADDAVPTRIAEELKLPVFYPGIVMEGGAVDFNGAGTVLTTTSCLLNKNRNPRLAKARIETYLRDYYGQKLVFGWVKVSRATIRTDTSTISRASSMSGRSRSASSPTSAIPITRSSRRRAGRSRGSAIRTAIHSRSSSCRCRRCCRLRRPASSRDLRELLLRQRSPARPDIRSARSRSAGDRRPPTTLAGPRSDWRRLPQADLGPRRHSLLHPTAAAVLVSRSRI